MLVLTTEAAPEKKLQGKQAGAREAPAAERRGPNRAENVVRIPPAA